VRIVVDASVAVKWYVHEVHTAAASRFLDARFEPIVPDLLWSEFGNILWKKLRRGDLTADAAHEIVGELKRVSIKTEPVAPFLEAALETAVKLGRTFYDGAYLTLAEHLDCRLVTADGKLYNAVQGDPVAAHVLWVEDEP
jgi:predicted nucleic acid-binding protein